MLCTNFDNCKIGTRALVTFVALNQIARFARIALQLK